MNQGDYDIPATAVAEEIITRLTLARRARAALAFGDETARGSSEPAPAGAKRKKRRRMH